MISTRTIFHSFGFDFFSISPGFILDWWLVLIIFSIHLFLFPPGFILDWWLLLIPFSIHLFLSPPGFGQYEHDTSANQKSWCHCSQSRNVAAPWEFFLTNWLQSSYLWQWCGLSGHCNKGCNGRWNHFVFSLNVLF